MILAAAAFAASLVVPISIDRTPSRPALPPVNESSLPVSRKIATVRPLVSSATECIVRAVSADPRFATADPVAMNSLIVDSMPSCLTALRAMMDAYDRLFGDGAGEKFFMGPYLDELPAAVNSRTRSER